MADNVLNARLQLRYDTYNHWMASSLILMPGEVAIATMTPISAESPAQVGIKVGDGIHYFDELQWIQAIAADVYEWAKQINKPQYNASEIVGLAEYIATHGGGGGSGGGSGETPSGTYQIIYDNAASKYILQYYDDDDGIWKNTTGEEIDLSSILSRLNNIERWANGETTHLGNIELPLTAFIYDEVMIYLNRLDVNDSAVAHQFVTAVSEQDGKISVSRSVITAADISSGVLPTEHGGTGLSRVEEDQVLIGSYGGNITTKTFVTTIDVEERNAFATVGAIIDYIAVATAGLTGAMHFVGEASVSIDLKTNNHANPQITGYDFSKAQPGDVILANNTQELVWTGTEWRLLGDEGSYAIKGSIKNVDIAEEANIAQNKIEGLVEALNAKVDKVEGKGLSTNDYTTEEKQKLAGIQVNAQANIIEHIFVNDVESVPTNVGGYDKSVNLQIPVLSADDVAKLESIEYGAQVNNIDHIYVNGTELNPVTINEVPKVVNIEFIPFTAENQEKLAGIEPEAQVNILETISINGTEYTADANKNINITINQAALELDVLAGARVPGTTLNTYEEVNVTTGIKLLELARIAKTGDIKDILQSNDEYVTFDCGSSIDVI